MNVLILGGQSSRHQQWVRDLAASLADQFETVKFIDYRHWQTNGDLDIDHELQEISKATQDLTNYVIIAKSIGSVLSILAISQGVCKPEKCVFLGFPLAEVTEHLPVLGSNLRDLPETIFVHNKHDPHGDASEIKAYLQANRVKNYQFFEQDGNTHDYVDFDLIAKLAA